jgi:D-glycero-D-manno-heptose 1,7-bisphosphate phosphatase
MGIDAVTLKAAIFLDRDGVINDAIVRDGRPYPPASLDQVVIRSPTVMALRRLADSGLALYGCTNQPDVARGTTARETVDAINGHILAHTPIIEIATCWHDDTDDCDCRKPRPGLILDLARRYSVDPALSWMVGDRWRDVSAGAAAGCRTIFIDYGYAEPFKGPAPDVVVGSLSEAAEHILRDWARRRAAA